jgi:hypothetical protein
MLTHAMYQHRIEYVWEISRSPLPQIRAVSHIKHEMSKPFFYQFVLRCTVNASGMSPLAAPFRQR